MFSEACKGVEHNPILLILAIGIAVFFILFTAFWLASFVYLYTIPISPAGQSPVEFSEKGRNLIIYQVFGIFLLI